MAEELTFVWTRVSSGQFDFGGNYLTPSIYRAQLPESGSLSFEVKGTLGSPFTPGL